MSITASSELLAHLAVSAGQIRGDSLWEAVLRMLYARLADTARIPQPTDPLERDVLGNLVEGPGPAISIAITA